MTNAMNDARATEVHKTINVLDINNNVFEYEVCNQIKLSQPQWIGTDNQDMTTQHIRMYKRQHTIKPHK